MSERVIESFKWKLMRRKEDNTEDQRARILHLSKRLREDEKTQSFLNEISQIDGIEGIKPDGPYSISIFIGQCFDVGIVVEDIERSIGRFQSGLVLPIGGLHKV